MINIIFKEFLSRKRIPTYASKILQGNFKLRHKTIRKEIQLYVANYR